MYHGTLEENNCKRITGRDQNLLTLDRIGIIIRKIPGIFRVLCGSGLLNS
jgi:hypothetical protein